MAKMDKDYELRMQGMIYASNIVSKKGVEGLKEDIRIRNVLKAPMKFTASQHWCFMKNTDLERNA